MRRKFEIMKSIQLALILLITAIGLLVIFTDSALYQMVGRDPSIRTLCILLWAALLLSYVCIYWDFRANSTFKKDYRELDFAVGNDRLSGMANRFTCDSMIAKYFDKPMPPTVGCIMLEIANLQSINQSVGRTGGNLVIQAFSEILTAASVGLCFVGRNGGNKFMALFEDCDETRLHVFLSRVTQRVEQYNSRMDMAPLEFRSGQAFREGPEVTDITKLIAKADQRMDHQTDAIVGLPNRNSCDEIINQYIDQPLPQDIGCIMLDLINLKEINEQYGRTEGNQQLRKLSDMLKAASLGTCFVGRNGGTCFMALFESCTQDKMNTFLEKVTNTLHEYNQSQPITIKLTWGSAFQEAAASSINQLVALANQRMHDHTIHMS